MRYARFIAAISLLFATAQAFACGPFIYPPSEYYMFHLVNLPDSPDGDFNRNSRENCLLWQQQTMEDIPLDDIYQVVYKYNLELITTLGSGILPMEAKDNKMARWLHSYHGKQALEFLVLAKNCEWLRNEALSPWYYPSEQAKNLYKLANDLNGLLECDLRYQPKMNRVEKMELLYEVYPDCPDFRRQIWEILGHVEPNRDWEDDWRWDWIYSDERATIDQLGKLCDRVLNDKTCADKALWAYAATYIAHLKGDDRKADRYLKLAENCVKDRNLSDAIKVMRIFIDSQISTYDKAYEQKLFAQLRWLQQMIEKNLDEKVIQGFCFYDLTSCFSYYYWNDAMRCILLGTVCPKMIQQGNTTLALQLANMSSYSLLNEMPINLYQYRHSRSFNGYDYCNHFARMADSLSANAMMAYTEVALRPKTEFQRFLNAHSYIERDYLNEMIGTHCLREMRYADAEQYFSRVSSGYFVRTNVYKEGYLNRDPFSVKQRKWNHGVDAKLCFARKMNQLEHEIASATDPNQKAMLMIDFGIGIRNSFDYCWALTQYYRGWVYGLGEDGENVDLTQQAEKRVDRLFSLAVNSFTDNEYAAQAQMLFGNFKTIAERFPETLAAVIVKGHCDQLVDYHAEMGF